MTACPLSHESNALRALLRSVVGPRCTLAGIRMVRDDGDYRVLLVTVRAPDRTVVVKLCPPDDPRAYGFATAAAFARLARDQAGVPTYDALDVDISGSRHPWAYLITSHVDGRHWHEVVPSLEPAQRRSLYEQLGRAVAGLHSIHFPGYGAMGSDGEIVPAPTYLEALSAWVVAHVADPRHVPLFLGLLAERAELFADVAAPQLTHEDLNPNNLLVHHDGSQWRLAAVVDYDKAWAGCGESDLARLELWRGMTGDGFFQGYTDLLPIPAGYASRRALYQLLWCLEYARPTPAHHADTRAVCASLGIAPIMFGSV